MVTIRILRQAAGVYRVQLEQSSGGCDWLIAIEPRASGTWLACADIVIRSGIIESRQPRGDRLGPRIVRCLVELAGLDEVLPGGLAAARGQFELTEGEKHFGGVVL